jgi:cytochrome c biogenesis protein CcmG, thiol:disulfide interchange protein DsbE
MRRAFLVLLLLAACAREQQSTSPRGTQPAARTTTVALQEENGPKADVGDVMPPYSARDLAGKPFDLASQKGDVVLLNVWATWCAPCRYEIPELEAMHRKYTGRGFKVIGVSVDSTSLDDVKQFVAENKMTYPVVLDPDGRIAKVLRTTVLPTSVIIGRDGRIIWRKIGAVMPNETASVEDVVKQALAKKG